MILTKLNHIMFSMNIAFRPVPLIDPYRRFTSSPRLGQDIITSIDQGPPAQPVPGVITSVTPPTSQPPGTSDSDWAKTIAAALKAASEGYGAYTKEEIARLNAEAAALKAKNPTVAPILNQAPQPASPLPYIILGLGVLGALGLFFVLTKK